MNFWPSKNDFIDFHSHHKKQEEGVFRVYNQLISEQTETSYSGTQSVGLHPWNIKDFQSYDKLESILEEKLLNEASLFVGECGLDKRIDTPLDQQIDIFNKHIRISENLGKPLIIHCVKAFQELLAIKKELKPQQKWIIHGFSGSPQLAESLIEMEFRLSIGNTLLSIPDKAGNVLKKISVNRLFIETDESKVDIKELYGRAALLLGMDIEKLKQTVLINFKELF